MLLLLLLLLLHPTHLYKQGGGVNLVALKVLGQAELVPKAPVGHTVVPDHRVSQGQQLEQGISSSSSSTCTERNRQGGEAVKHKAQS